jgi:(2Fe-2S) ferredoxin
MYVEPEGIWYSRFTLKDVPVIVRQHLRNNRPVKRLVHYPDRLVPAKPRWTKAKVVQRGKRKLYA